MKYYYREIVVREPINRFGRLGLVDKIEMVKTNDIKPFNYHKHIKFRECAESEKKIIKELRKLERDKVYIKDARML